MNLLWYCLEFAWGIFTLRDSCLVLRQLCMAFIIAFKLSIAAISGFDILSFLLYFFPSLWFCLWCRCLIFHDFAIQWVKDPYVNQFLFREDMFWGVSYWKSHVIINVFWCNSSTEVLILFCYFYICWICNILDSSCELFLCICSCPSNLLLSMNYKSNLILKTCKGHIYMFMWR